MRLPIVLVSSALILAGLNVAYPVINDLTTRSGNYNSVFNAEFGAQALEAVVGKFQSFVSAPKESHEREKPKIPQKTVQPAEPINISQHDKSPVVSAEPINISQKDKSPVVPGLRHRPSYQREHSRRSQRPPLPASQMYSGNHEHDAGHDAGTSGSRSRRAFYDFDWMP